MIEARGLTKAFDSTIALQGFDFKIDPGEIVAIVGENGAGKSTFMKLLSGVHSPTSGEIYVDESPVTFKNPREAQALGIAMVHQELNLIAPLSAADNLFLGRELVKGGSINRRETEDQAGKYLQSVGAKFPANTLCQELSIAEQQLVEIAKAVSFDSRLVIFDEPTAVLSEVESKLLFDLIRDLKSRGVAILYVSHRLPEILALADRIIVLRDGQRVAERTPEGLTEGQLANLMVGRALQDIFPAKTSVTGDIALSAKNIASPLLVHDVSFDVRAGEILGLAGLIGAGRTEVCEAIVGLRKSTAGTTHIGGSAVKIGNYREAIENHLAYVSEDRKGKGLVVSMSVEDNIRLASLEQPTDVSEWIKELAIKVSNPALPMTSLSGGNQQKASIAKWLITQPKVLFLDEPTRGVDVGAKAEIYRLIAELAAKGMACVVVSSEMPELIGLCHRVVVLRDGRNAGEAEGEGLTEENLMQLAAGVAEAA